MSAWDDLLAAVKARRIARAELRRIIESLPPGGVQKAWDEDLLTVELAEEAAKWRHHKGLEP